MTAVHFNYSFGDHLYPCTYDVQADQMTVAAIGNTDPRRRNEAQAAVGSSLLEARMPRGPATGERGAVAKKKPGPANQAEIWTISVRATDMLRAQDFDCFHPRNISPSDGLTPCARNVRGTMVVQLF